MARNPQFFRNTGSATSPAFAATVVVNPFGIASAGAPAGLAAADLNADGNADLLISTVSGDIHQKR